jgi:hypothetical protein
MQIPLLSIAKVNPIRLLNSIRDQLFFITRGLTVTLVLKSKAVDEINTNCVHTVSMVVELFS